MNESPKKSDHKTIVGTIAFVVLSLAGIFIYDYFDKKNLLKTGIHTIAVVTDRYYEINTDNNDTTSYSIRMKAIADTNHGEYVLGEVLNAYIKAPAFYKYEEGSVVQVVYRKNDLNHAMLVEEIE